MTTTSRTHHAVSAATLLAAATASAGPPPCTDAGGSGSVQALVFVRNLDGQTSWFASPLIADLDGDGANEIVAAHHDIFVSAADGFESGAAGNWSETVF